MYLVKILLLFLLALFSRAAVHLKSTKIECITNPTYFHNNTCYLKAINRYKSLAFLETHIKDILRNVSVNMGLYSRNSANNYNPYFVNFTSNASKFLDKKSSGLYINSFMNMLKKHSNVNHSCPYTGYFRARNIYLDGTIFPLPPLPKNSYKFEIIFYEGYPFNYMGMISLYVDLIISKN